MTTSRKRIWPTDYPFRNRYQLNGAFWILAVCFASYALGSVLGMLTR